MGGIFKFHRFNPFYWWPGRYGRLIGGSTWKVALSNEILVVWNKYSDTQILLKAKKSEETKKMAEAINEAKKIMGSYGGGVFVINEFGQVIVPSSDGGGKRILVGEIEGPLLLKDPSAGPSEPNWIDISDDSRFKYGDRWPYPYLGVVYRLSENNSIYYKEESEDERRAVYPDEMDEKLIKKIRTIRPYGPVRFVVNPYGIVLTKRPPRSSNRFGFRKFEDEEWEAVYAGRIDYNKWFNKEE